MTKKIKCSSISIQITALAFRRCAMLLDCADCGLVTSVHIKREEDGTLSFYSQNEDEHYQIVKKSPSKPFLGVTQGGSLLISCGACISKGKVPPSLEANPDVGTFSINGKSNRCTSRNHEGLVCSYPLWHNYEHAHTRAGLIVAKWGGDFDGGYYLNLLSVTPGIDKSTGPSI